MNVKRTFFISEDEASKLRKTLDNSYITHRFPCYELDSGEIIYPKIGYPAAGEVWYQDSTKTYFGTPLETS